MGRSWDERLSCGSPTPIAEDVRSTWIDPASNAIFVIVGATSTSPERIVCAQLGIDHALRRWEERISWVGFVRGANLRAVAVVCDRQENKRVILTRGEALDAPVELGRANAKTNVSVRFTRDGERIIVAGLGAYIFDREGRRLGERVEHFGAGKGHVLLSADAQVWVHAEQLQLEDGRQTLVRSWRVQGSRDLQAEIVPLSAREWITREIMGERRFRRWSIDQSEPVELVRVPSRVNGIIDGAGPWFAARDGSTLVFCASDDGAEITSFADAKLLTMNDDSAAIAQHGRARVVRRETAATEDRVEDFTTIDQVFVSDRGAVVAQDRHGTTRFFSDLTGELVAEHRHSTHRGTLIGLARGGTVAVQMVRVDGRVRALRFVEAREGFAHEIESAPPDRDGELPSSVAGFRDDLAQFSLVYEKDRARTMELVENGRVLLPLRLADNSRSIASASIDEARLVLVDSGRLQVFCLTDRGWVERSRATLTPAASQRAFHWGSLSHGDTEDKINSTALRIEDDGARIGEPTTVVLNSRSRQQPVAAERSAVVAWVRFDRQAVAVRQLADDKPTWVVAVERASTDEVVGVALSPSAEWLAIALRSGILRRFQWS